MERDVAKFMLAALGVAALYDIATHGAAMAQVFTSGGKAVANLFAVLTGQKPAA
jgi:hypothetical protein